MNQAAGQERDPWTDRLNSDMDQGADREIGSWRHGHNNSGTHQEADRESGPGKGASKSGMHQGAVQGTGPWKGDYRNSERVAEKTQKIFIETKHLKTLACSILMMLEEAEAVMQSGL